MNELYRDCISKLDDGNYLKIDNILKKYFDGLDDGYGNENDYKDGFHLVIKKAIKKYESEKNKNDDFASWICENILSYYSHTYLIEDSIRLKFNAFLKTNNIDDNLMDDILIALYGFEFKNLRKIFKSYSQTEDSEYPSANFFQAVQCVQQYADIMKGDLRVELMDILEGHLLKYIPKADPDCLEYKELIKGIDNIDLSCPTNASKKSYRHRLMVGEANFTYTVSLLKKHAEDHPDLGKSITSTEFLSKADLKKAYPSTVTKNIDYIKKHGGTVFTSTDARLINEYELPHKRYHRIHFNMPYDQGSYHNRTLPVILKEFFLAAREIQEINDRVHMALPVPVNMDFRHAYVYDIYEATARAGYQLVAKRRFDSVRYPGYQHSITNNDKSAAITEKGIREFIFQKTNYTYEELLEKSPPRKKWICYDKKNYNYHKHIETDSGSSDYLTDEEPAKPRKPKI